MRKIKTFLMIVLCATTVVIVKNGNALFSISGASSPLILKTEQKNYHIGDEVVVLVKDGNIQTMGTNNDVVQEVAQGKKKENEQQEQGEQQEEKTEPEQTKKENWLKVKMKIPKGLDFQLAKSEAFNQKNQLNQGEYVYNEQTRELSVTIKEQSRDTFAIVLQVAEVADYQIVAVEETEKGETQQSNLLAIKVLAEEEGSLPKEESTDEKSKKEPEKEKSSSKSKKTRAALADEVKEVKTWDELSTALTSPEDENIVVTQDLQATKNINVVGKNKVSFQNHLVDVRTFRFQLSGSNKLTVSDMNFTGAAAGSLFTGNGEAQIEGSFKTKEGNLAQLAGMSGGTVTIDGADLTYDRGNNANFGIEAKNFSITNHAKVVSESQKFYGISQAADAGAQIRIDKGSKVTTNSMKGTTSNTQGQAWDIRQRADIFIDGNGTTLKVNGNGRQRADNGGIFLILADNTTLNVTNHAEMDVHSKYTSAILIQSEGGIFNVSNNSKLFLIQDGDDGYALGSTLRFRLRGNMKFNVSDNAEINIAKESGTAPAVRMYGGNNIVTAKSGADFKVRNKGNGSPANPGGDARNQAIQYTAGNNNEFNVEDEKSNVEITADSGAALDAGSQSLTIRATKDTYFVSRGVTAAATSGIVNGGAISFQMSSPRYFDFSNTRSGGGYIFTANASSSFTSTDSRLSLWKAGDSVNGDPTYDYGKLDYSASGANFQTLNSSTSTLLNQQFGSMTNYTRMTSNNQSTIIKELRVPTNADKAIYLYASIPGAKDEYRGAYSGEAHAKVKVMDKDGKQKAILSGQSEKLGVYGDPERLGIIRIDTLDKAFLETGDRVSIQSAWRGVAEESSSENIISSPDEIEPGEVKTYDVTPPAPAEIKDMDKISYKSKSISGKGAPGSVVTLTLNGNATSETATVDADGNFKISLPNEMHEDDLVQVFLRDKAGAAAIKNPPATNNAIGNINPAANMAFHDAEFPKATEFTLSGILELLSVPEQLDFGNMGITAKKKTYKADNYNSELIIQDSRKVRDSWQLNVALSSPLTGEQTGKQLSNFYYMDGGNKKMLTSETLVIEAGINPNSDPNVISNKWNDAANGFFLEVEQGEARADSYQGELIWSLQDAP